MSISLHMRLIGKNELYTSVPPPTTYDVTYDLVTPCDQVLCCDNVTELYTAVCVYSPVSTCRGLRPYV